MKVLLGIGFCVYVFLSAHAQDVSSGANVLAGAPSFSVDVRLIEIAASVFDGDEPVHRLTQEHFRVSEGGSTHEILAFEATGERLQCAILLDATGSMRPHLPALKEAVLGFLDGMKREDEVALFSFGRGFRQEQRFTRDRRLAKKAMLAIQPEGDTALFDAMARVIRELERRQGKKALIVFSDGRDNKSSLNAGSASRRARLAGIPVYAIAQGEASRSQELQRVLAEVADNTGGLSFRVKNSKDLGRVFAEINRNLSSTYMLAIKAPENAERGWHPIDVKVEAQRRFRVRARKGYELQ